MRVGDVIAGKYRLDRVLGEGSFGAVYEAVNLSIGRRVAVKVLNDEKLGNPETVNRFIWEAKTATAIGSQHIVDVLDAGQLTDGEPYLVMELLEGETVASFSSRCGRLDPALAVELVLQVCDALTPAHRQGIIHRDIKPENLFITRLGDNPRWVKVLDFGVAKARESVRDEVSQLWSTRLPMGTPFYMAPELFETPADADHRIDVYSTGVILYELLTRELPHTASTFKDLILHVFTRDPVPLRTIRPELSVELERVIDKAVARDPAKRYQSMEELAGELRALAPRPLVASAAAPRRRRWWLAGLVATAVGSALALAAAAGWHAWAARGAGGAVARTTGPARGDRTVAPVKEGPAAGERAAPVKTGPPGRTQPAVDERNPWVPVAPAPPGLVLGLPGPATAPAERGFAAERRVTAPTYAYEIQQHEVTWGELGPWLAQRPDLRVEPPDWLPAVARERYPATNVQWETALAYCRSVGGSLPTEEEWELAARGPSLRPYPWGEQTIDLARTHVFRQGDQLSAVMTNDQDATPGEAPGAIHDLLGNAREWTADLWRLDEPAAPEAEAWVQAAGRTYRPVRGLPPAGAPPAVLPRFGAASRASLCATGPCAVDEAQAERYRELLQHVGFRCARRAGAR
jgi:serine/threonine-protein kinase